MYEQVVAEISRFVAEDEGNRFADGSAPYFDAPLVGFAAADSPLFRQYQQIIGPFHRTPDQILPGAATVIVWSLPITRSTREANRRENEYPSHAWALTRCFGEDFNISLRRHLVAWLERHGYRAIAPQLDPAWQEYADTPVGVASTWSERHAAYAAGLGTFSLNDALITPRGIAHRLGSVITDLALPPSCSELPEYRSNCLFYRNGTCGACITRCPVGALSRDGHDKSRCKAYVYGTLADLLAERYGTPKPGCGLCQTKVPCEERIPTAV
ncbi:epoxyqueuosine reductase [Trichlorobacter ammonificans]|uniref:Iron-sulfur cluster-binding protein n=1 Tax=Trichlorobacter ammonificans TaxID=2916410 RepID=A0ABN8HFG7_9BACT|nr:epoxyqueuosine reductase [Trichlorobacter ammonificans]CAH2031605.1 Iron-sulfur cluster-binding protein [Trichlorobacter ammonificans]